MLLFVIFGFIIITIAYLLVDRSKSALFICLANVGTVIYMFAYVLIWLKYGGFQQTAQLALTLFPSISRALVYMPISADNLSLLLVAGKSLFLVGSMLLSINLFCFESKTTTRILNLITVMAGLIHFILLHPSIFTLYCNIGFFSRNQNIMFHGIRIFYCLCLLSTLILMCLCLYKIRIPWVRSKFKQVLILTGIMSFLFFMIGVLGPIQISYPNGFYYLSSNLLYSTSIIPWTVISIGSLVCVIIGSLAFMRYSKINRRIAQPDFNIEKKLNNSRGSVTMITHGMKNQLLVLNAIVNDLKSSPVENPSNDSRIRDMEIICSTMLNKVNQMHNVFQNNSLTLSINDPVSIMQEAVRQAETSLIPIETVIQTYSNILADKPYLVEALVNIIKNSEDAIKRTANPEEGLIRIKLYMNRDEVVFEINDNGEGIQKKDIRHIFDPFFSRKNSRNNWGLGLSFVQKIIKHHFGKISVDSEPGIGTTIYITIPKYRGV